MADWGQFEEGTAAEQASAQPTACQVCEAMLPDAVDGVLSEAEQRAFDRHVAGCVVCTRELEEAQRGAAWLGLLKQQSPEPSSALLDRILAQTTGAQAVAAEVLVAQAAERRAAAMRAVPLEAPEPVPAWASLPEVSASPAAVSRWKSLRGALSLEWMRPMLQPRMAMTAAMAFFSIALTLNLTGVRLNQLSTASLRPSAVRRVVADRSAAAVRSFQNMRVVYQAEAQVNDLRSNWQSEGAQSPDREPQQQETGPGQPKEPKGPKKDAPQGSSQLDWTPVRPQDAGLTRKGA